MPTLRRSSRLAELFLLELQCCKSSGELRMLYETFHLNFVLSSPYYLQL